MPGCKHGSCINEPMTCQCDSGWIGPLCDCPRCKDGCNLDHGYCTKPDECICVPGWNGELCNECIPHPGCPEGRHFFAHLESHF